jgi:hypothetical protein
MIKQEKLTNKLLENRKQLRTIDDDMANLPWE